MIQEIMGKSGAYIIDFQDVSGSGWANLIEKIIKEKIKPKKIDKRDIEVSWDYSEYEFDIEKDNVKFILHIDDDVSPYFSLSKENITEESKNKLRDWAMIVAKEVEKQREKGMRL